MKDIVPDIQEYEFRSFSSKPANSEVEDFVFEDLKGKSIAQVEKEQLALKIEREHSERTGFDISPIVRQHRGIKDQEIDERERRIADEVNKRVAKIEEQAYKEGYDEGVKRGREDVYEQTRAATEEKLISLQEMISETLSTKEEILKAQKQQLYTLIRNISKWVVLRELKDDGAYIERLLEKLILEAGVKSNLLIQVDQKHFEQMPEVLETVQEKLGEFTNVRVETDYDIQGTGLVVESDNGIINGSMREQFRSLDKLFESVGLEASTEDALEVDGDESE